MASDRKRVDSLVVAFQVRGVVKQQRAHTTASAPLVCIGHTFCADNIGQMVCRREHDPKRRVPCLGVEGDKILLTTYNIINKECERASYKSTHSRIRKHKLTTQRSELLQEFLVDREDLLHL